MRTILITGASRGIGAATALLAAKAGYTVVVNYHKNRSAAGTSVAAITVAAENIRVNGVRPAFIYTGIHADGGEPGRGDRIRESIPMKRGGFAEEVAEAILWLASDKASYSTGTFIDVSGGR